MTIHYSELAKHYPRHFKEALDCALSYLSQNVPYNITFERIKSASSSSQLYRFATAHDRFILRIVDLKSCSDPGYAASRRKNEIEAHKAAASTGVAPKLIYSDPKEIIAVIEEVPGGSLSLQDCEDPVKRSLLARKLKEVHAHPFCPPLKRAQLSRTAHHYKQAKAKGVALPTCFKELFEEVLEEAETRDQCTLTHGDLHPGNILMNGDNIFFIDWAYASYDDPLTDVAYLTILSGMDEQQTLSFYSSYLGRVPSEKERLLLAKAQANTCLMLSIALFALSQRDCPFSEPIEERVEKLNALLHSQEVKEIRDYTQAANPIHPRSSTLPDVQLCALAFLKECIKKRGGCQSSLSKSALASSGKDCLL